MKDDAIPLVRAAAILKMNYQRAMNLVLRGRIRGWQDEGRHWHVRTEDVLMYARTREPVAEQGQGS